MSDNFGMYREESPVTWEAAQHFNDSAAAFDAGEKDDQSMLTMLQANTRAVLLAMAELERQLRELQGKA